MTARAQTSRAGVRPVTATAPAHRAGLAWPRLRAAAELATIGAGYGAYALVRLAIHAGRHAAFGHAAQLWQAERRMHLTVEPYLNQNNAAGEVGVSPGGHRINQGLPRGHYPGPSPECSTRKCTFG